VATQSPLQNRRLPRGAEAPLATTIMTLSWESTYAIALELKRRHKDMNIEDVTLKQIYDWTLQLPDFEDDPSLVNDEILYAIYQDWFEENIHGK
jgi:FeS assembly protein IscX